MEFVIIGILLSPSPVDDRIRVFGSWEGAMVGAAEPSNWQCHSVPQRGLLNFTIAPSFQCRSVRAAIFATNTMLIACHMQLTYLHFLAKSDKYYYSDE